MKIRALVLFGSMALAPVAFAQGVNDAQIAAIVVTANQVDIDAGKLAASMGSTPEVKKFGEQMVKDHTGVNKSAVDLVIDALDKTLIPGATNPELKALLVKVRPAFLGHLAHAKHLQSTMTSN